ncbi:MAG: hypothetical protein R6W89_10930 [Candidatus Hydrogenedentota bacterium]
MSRLEGGDMVLANSYPAIGVFPPLFPVAFLHGIVGSNVDQPNMGSGKKTTETI